MKMQREIRFKNVVFLTSRMFASSMIRVFPSLEHSAGHVRIPGRQFVGLLCVPYGHLWAKHNRGRSRCLNCHLPCFLIADGSEFRFARVYIVCEEVPLGTPESPPIVSGVSDITRRIIKTWKRHRNLMQTFSRKKCSHFLQQIFPLHFHMKSPDLFFYITFLPQRLGFFGAFLLCFPEQKFHYTGSPV